MNKKQSDGQQIDRLYDLLVLAERVARLNKATRDFSPGIGDGMLNNLIDEARRLTGISEADHG